MSARSLLEELRRQDVHLEAEAGRLHVDAPARALTYMLRSSLVENKDNLIKLLEQERVWLEAANRRGLLIRWSEYPVWIQLHDPFTGDWHEVKASECLPGVVETAERYRKKGG